GGPVAARAARDRMLALELPAGELVVERLAAADRAPPHQIEAPAAVLLVAHLARVALHARRRMEALAGVDPLLEVLVFVAAEAPGGRDRLVGLVAGRALILAIDRGVARRQLAGRRLQEVVGAAAPGGDRDHRTDEHALTELVHDYNEVLMPSWTSCAVSMRRVRVAPGCRTDIPVHWVDARPKS